MGEARIITRTEVEALAQTPGRTIVCLEENVCGLHLTTGAVIPGAGADGGCLIRYPGRDGQSSQEDRQRWNERHTLEHYGKRWRLWTSAPTPAQKVAEPWEEEERAQVSMRDLMEQGAEQTRLTLEREET